MNEIEEIKQKLSIVDVVGQYVSLKKAGRNYKGVCPFHAENTPSFMVSEELGIYKCFGCNNGGDIFKFTQEIEGIDFSDALAKLADRAGVKLKNAAGADPMAEKRKILYEINHLAAEFYYYILTKHAAGKFGLDYLLTKRKLTKETISVFKIGFAPNEWDILLRFLTKKGYTTEQLFDAGVIVPKSNGNGYIDKFRNRIVFPLISIDDKFLGFTGRVMDDSTPKYLNSPETVVFHKSSYIYSLNNAKTFIKKQGVVFVEGQFDVITPFQHGYKNIVAASGTALTASQLNIISRYSKDLTFCYDSDTAGSAATLRALELAEHEGFNVRVIVMPKGIKDLDELFNNSPKDVESVFKNTLPAYDYYLAAALGRNNKNDSIGKKKIIEELTPVYSRINNKITLDYYIKKVSEELGTSEEVVSDYFKNPTAKRSTEAVEAKKTFQDAIYSYKQSPEAYMLALLLKAPVDKTKAFLYGNDQISLNDNYFTDAGLKGIFSMYKDFLAGNQQKVDIKYFSSTLDENAKNLVNELFLWDLDYILADPKALDAELSSIYLRLHSAYVKHKRIELAQKIKEAEIARDEKLIKKLTKEFEKIA